MNVTLIVKGNISGEYAPPEFGPPTGRQWPLCDGTTHTLVMLQATTAPAAHSIVSCPCTHVP